MPSSTEIKWVKNGTPQDFVFLGKDVIATASGIHVTFFHLNTREERIESFDNAERGDGASCLAGHPTVSMFSVAERRMNPKISIFTYPTMQKVSHCSVKSKINGYLSCTFAGTDYLLGLTTLPDYQVIVWYWRTGENLTRISTEMNGPFQTIACSPNSPYIISQFSQETGKLLLYRMHLCGKFINLLPITQEIKLLQEEISSLSWSQDGNVFLCDIFCNVWLLATDIHTSYVIHKSHVLNSHKDDENYRTPLVMAYQDGVIIADLEYKVKLYVRSADSKYSWRVMWSLIMESQPIQVGTHFHREGFLCRTNNGAVYEINVHSDNLPRAELIRTDSIKYVALSPILSHAKHIVVIDEHHRLYVIEALTGKIGGRLYLGHHGKVISLDCHPFLPIIAAASTTGNFLLIGISSPLKPNILKCFHVHTKPLDRAKFSDKGGIFGAATMQIGYIFLVGRKPCEKETKILGLIKTERQIIEFLIYETADKTMKILVLIKPNSCTRFVGNVIIVYTCTTVNDFKEEISHAIKLPSIFKKLSYGVGESTEIIGVPYLTKQLHKMQIQNNFEDILLTEIIPLIHQLRGIEVNINSRFTTTYGYDGAIIARENTNLQKINILCIPHHRTQGGVKYAIATFHGIIISLGRNGDLIGSVSRNVDLNVEKIAETTPSLNCSHFQELLSDTIDYSNETIVDDVAETWMENVAIAKEKAENILYHPVKVSIREDLDKLKKEEKGKKSSKAESNGESLTRASKVNMRTKGRKKKTFTLSRTIEDFDLISRVINNKKKIRIKHLLDLNEKEPEDNRLPISCFDLDQEYRKRKMEIAKQERYETERNIEKQIIQQDEIAAYLRELFWDPMKVHPCDVRSFFGQAKISNYPLFNGIQEIDNFRFSDDFSFERNFIKNDYPRQSIVKNKIQDTEELENDENNGKFYISGTTTHKWIPDDTVTPLENCENLFSICNENMNVDRLDRERKLKVYFNDIFKEIQAMKKEKFTVMVKQIDRLHYCASELKEISGIVKSIEPATYPQWHSTEIPDKIISVDDEEISVEKYSSPRITEQFPENELKKEKSNSIVEEENCYETALEKMMDGVLEIRWEDEIKKDIPKPHCLLADVSSPFSEEDMKIIEAYNAKILALEDNRSKYKSMLETEFDEIKDRIQTEIRSFDEQISVFDLKKIQIDSSILQEKLMRLRGIQRIKSKQKREEEKSIFIEKTIIPTTKEAKHLADLCATFEEVTLDLRTRYENLLKRDKQLEIKFRTEFEDLKQPMVEHLFRHYKRRPRIGWMICTSQAHLSELARCLINNERSMILPRECLDFLRGMDILDVMPATLPTQIDIIHWRTMCKLRRIKIESETKVRSCALELAEAEQSYGFYQKLNQSTQNKVVQLKHHLNDLEKTSNEFSNCEEIQLVLKTGQIEISLEGRLTDLESAVLVPREEFCRINEIIVAAGKQKLSAMYKAIDYRKMIECEEWHHRRTKMIMEDLKEHLNCLRAVKLTREVQEYAEQYPNVLTAEKEAKLIEKTMQTRKDRLNRIVLNENTRLEKLLKDTQHWQKENQKVTEKIEEARHINSEYTAAAEDPTRIKYEEFQKKKINAIMRKTKLIEQIKQNYEKLLILHAQLEISKLRIYPTLKLKTTD